VLVLLLVLGGLFQAIYSWSGPLMDLIESSIGQFGDWIGSGLDEGPLRSLLVDGVVGGAGGVLVFLPQIAILFLFLALLEDIGYMARAAFLMDRLLSRFGLSGRSFIPLLSSFACAIPGIMGARVIGDRNTRLTTIFLAPLMSCSARLPVYTLMIAALVPQTTYFGWIELQGLVLLAMYSIGILAAIPTAWVMQRWVLRAPVSPFLLELPSYKRPLLSNVLRVLYERCSAFIIRAGTLILATSVIVWALGYFPRDAALLARQAEERAQLEQRADPDREEQLAVLDNQHAGELASQSYLGRVGRWIEPMVRPLGWDWRIAMAAIASFPAREVVIANLGTIFNLGNETDETSVSLQDTLRAARDAEGRPLFTLATGLSLMVFFALCAQCAATLVVMYRETRSWTWPLASFTYMTALAYVAALVTYQVAHAMGG
jgi:ferrous iron transport protein B